MTTTETPVPGKSESSPTLENFAAWSLGVGLPVLVGALCLWEFLSWAPNYLTWPLWADHDVFSTAARSWDAGILPYRDLRGNNFPGTTYLFWVVGKVFGFGWAQAPGFYGIDAGLVGLFGLLLVIWSRRTLGGAMPGLIAFGSFLGYYLALDYSQAAQRDWQGPVLAVMGLLVLQASPGRGSRFVGAMLTAFGLIIRPQAVLLLPAQAFAIFSEARARQKSWFVALLEWGGMLAAGVVMGFLPVILGGLWPDFLASLKVVSYGGKYNLVTASGFVFQFLKQLLPLRVDIVPLGVLLLGSLARAETRKTARPWLIAFLGVLLYRPLSPHPHAYLTHPLMIVWAGLVAILVQTVLDGTRLPSTVRLVAVLLIAGLGLTAKPRFCNPNGSVEALGVLRTKTEAGPKPTGYANNPDVPASSYYEWKDYRELLGYLRKNIQATTRVANCLKEVPAITGPTGHLSAFPAESIAWVIVVRSEDEQAFADSLRATPDSVVVWAPSEKTIDRGHKLLILFATIEELYEPSEKFGVIEVWKRKSAREPSTVGE